MDRNEFRKVFDKRLVAFLDEKIDHLRPYFFDETLERMITYITSFAEWGKRFRPYLVYLFYKAYEWEDDDYIINVTITNELIHLFGLMHDDISDKGTIRHNIPTYHKFIEWLLNSDFQGISQTIWIANLVYTRSINHFTSLVDDKFVLKLLFDMVEETIYGQIVDIHLSYSEELSSKDMVKFKDKWKSWYYSFKKPMMLWAALAGIRNLEKIEQLGDDLGLAFQMRDDLLDVNWWHKDKTPFSDHQEGNQTYLLSFALEKANKADKQFVLETRGQTLSQEKIARLRDIFEKTGTIEHAKQQVNNLLNTSTERLHSLFKESNRYKWHIQFIVDYLHV